jgi:hypothetical protein
MLEQGEMDAKAIRHELEKLWGVDVHLELVGNTSNADDRLHHESSFSEQLMFDLF